GQADARVETLLAHAPAHLVEADPVADDQEARVGLAREHGARGFEEDVVALRATHVGDEPDDGSVAQPELAADRTAGHAGMKPVALDPGGDRQHALGSDAR